MSFQREGGGGGAGTTFAPMDRLAFVRSIVDEFERNSLGVDERVVDYILSAALPAEPDWAAALESGRVNLHDVQAALMDALSESGQQVRASGGYLVDLATAKQVFPAVVQARWHCPYPLLLC